MELPETRYARSGEVSIAYQVTGAGPFDLVYAPPFVTNVELTWTVPSWAALMRRFSSFSRLIRFDKRGTGMSDRVAVGDLETRMDDIRAVMDAVGCARAALIGASEGGPLSLLFAATYPERVWALVLWGTFPRLRWAHDYPWGLREEELAEETASEERLWTEPGFAERAAAETGAPDPIELAAMWRQSASPGAIRLLDQVTAETDVRHVLRAISAPTLVLNRTGDAPDIVAGSRYLAEQISGARHVEFPGSAHVMYGGEVEPVVAEIRSFLTDAYAAEAAAPEPERVLATVLFTDIVGSTARAAAIGDAAWSRLLEAHHAEVRRQLLRHHGREIDTAGDGFLASFDGPARAIRCAGEIVEAVRGLGLEVRTGLHSGECELLDGKITGIAVHIGARVAAEAAANEILVSSTVKDLVTGSGIAFSDRGAAAFKGLPGEWQLYAAHP